MNALPLLVCACVLVYGTFAEDKTCNNVIVASNCKCFSNKAWKIKIDCNFTNYSDKLEFTDLNVTTLELVNVKPDLSFADILNKLKLKKLILHNVIMHYLHLPWQPWIVSGTNDTLKMLEVYNSRFIFAWDFSFLGPTKSLTHLVIVESPLFYLFSSIGEYTSLEHLELRNDNLQTIRDNEFSQLYNLRLLSLSGNNLKRIKRKMFPQRAEYLWHLDFSHNKLTKLPSDIFKGMAQLKEIRLDHNELVTLKETVFSSIGTNLKELWMHNNNLNCSDELIWMKNLRLPVYTLIAQCRTKTDERGFRSYSMK